MSCIDQESVSRRSAVIVCDPTIFVPKRDNSTRWNSIFKMISRALIYNKRLTSASFRTLRLPISMRSSVELAERKDSLKESRLEKHQRALMLQTIVFLSYHTRRRLVCGVKHHEMTSTPPQWPLRDFCISRTLLAVQTYRHTHLGG
jgi:hypothetical protein